MSKQYIPKWLMILLSIIIIGVLSFYTYVWVNDPLKVEGWSAANSEQNKMYISLSNMGSKDIKIVKIIVNGDVQPEQESFVMSYTGQVVSAGIEQSGQAKFVPFNEGVLSKQLTEQEVQQLLKKKDNQVPIHYGLLVTAQERIDRLEISYHYYGMIKSKNILVNQSES